VVANITYGSGIPGETELRLCGDVGGAKRAVELGVSEWMNSIALARAGARAIAVDPRHDRIAELRTRADEAEVTVQCHETAMADLGDITSGTCAVVVAAQTLGEVDDLGRLLRQVHRILEPSMPFVISVPHPFQSVSAGRHYGVGERSIGEWFTALGRANFRVDQLIELGVGVGGPIPSTLVLRARKEGS
jgi:SAM-dependent methyltransferase